MRSSATQDVPARDDLRSAGARSALWQGLAFALSKAAVLVTTVVLARLLAPEQYGLVALALVFVAYAQTVADAGVAQALVYLPRSSPTVRAAMSCALLVGVLLVAVATVSAPLVAAFFQRPDVEPLVRLCAVSLLASSLGSVPDALLRRDLLFSRITVARVVSAVATGATSIGLAAAGAGPWAIAWGAVVGSTVATVVSWIVLPVRPDALLWRTTRSDVRAVLAYGIPVAGASLLGKLVFDADYLVIGRQLGAEQLAYYTFAFKLPELVILNVFFVLLSVTFPLFTRARSDPERLRRGYLFSIRLQSLYGVVAGVGLAVTAPLAVRVLFGEAWAPAAGALTALALYAALRTIGGGANEVYKALGRPGIPLVISVIRLVVLVPVLLFATTWGIDGVAWAQVVLAAVFAIAMQAVALHVLQLDARRLLLALAPAASVAPAVAVVAGLLARLPLPPALTLVVAGAGGGAAAVAVLVVAYPALVKDVIGLLRRRSVAT
ncbi:lipopolysaccharide biosynthesis protein [Geodermatophilus sp. URMC 62]|uniref:lipopolysaccharide biosynthesis protein n=1 Tax=Geodermatophilus sp. URMC 62 TaxID=3423414 RepID=UPI00406C48AA